MSKTTEITNNTAAEAPLTLLQSFRDLGMFASPDVKPDTIDLPDGKVAAFFVRELPDAEFRKLWEGGDRAKLIAATICDADGKHVMDVATAAKLKPSLAAQFQNKVLAHAGFGEAGGKIKEEAGND